MLRLAFSRFAFLFLFALTANVSFAGIPTEAEFAASINIAGRQRMLAQRAAKEALQIVLGVEGEKSADNLKKTMTLFEQSLQSLSKGNPSMGLPVPGEAVAKGIEAEEAAWKILKADLENVLAGKPDVANLGTSDSEVALEAQALVTLLEGEYQTATGKLWGGVVDLSGKQRMLSQKMAKEVYQVLLKANAETHRAALKLAVETFDDTQKGLLNGDAKLSLPPTTDKKARAQLELAGRVWARFRPYLEKVLKKETLSAEDLLKVADINIQLLDETEKVVSIFEGLAGEK